jgi:hypothetical protein
MHNVMPAVIRRAGSYNYKPASATLHFHGVPLTAIGSLPFATQCCHLQRRPASHSPPIRNAVLPAMPCGHHRAASHAAVCCAVSCGRKILMGVQCT